MSQNYYQLLGVSPSAPAADIKQAYRQLATRYHPDKHGGDARYEEQFKAVAVAYATLSNPDRRAQYDYQLQLAARQAEALRQAPPTPAPTDPRKYGTAGRPVAGQPLRTRQPASSRERHYQRIPRQRVRFTRQDFLWSAALLALIILFSWSVKVVMDRVTATSHYEQAQRELAGGNWLAAIGSLNLSLDIRPNFAPALNLIGQLNQDRAHNLLAAAADYKAALASTDDPLPAGELPYTFYRLGCCQVALGQFYSADTSYCRAHTLDPTLADAYLARGENRLLDLHQPTEALADLRRGHRQYQRQGRPLPLAYLQAEGAALTHLARYAEARTVYEEALLTQPRDGRTLFLLGRLAQQAGDSVSGCEFFRRGAAAGYSYATAAAAGCQ